MGLIRGPEELAKENGMEAEFFALIHRPESCELYTWRVEVKRPPTRIAKNKVEIPIEVNKLECRTHGVESGLYYLSAGKRVTFRE